MIATPSTVVPLAPSWGASAAQSFTQREQLPLQANQLWLIESGIVKTLTWSEEGYSTLLGIWGPGDIIGRPLVGLNPYQAFCLTPAVAAPLPKDEWPDMSQALVRHIRHSNVLMELLHIPQADVRIFRALSWLTQRFGLQYPEGRQLSFHVTHQDLADLTGLTRVTVTRLLNELDKQGLIHRQKRLITITANNDPFWHYEI
ncbi:MAG TPA: Crp/Fnr family transcriptional regulator [Trichocoleus sp.]